MKRAAREHGFHAAGIARVPPSTAPVPAPHAGGALSHRLGHWLACGYHGAMAWMGRHPHRRSHPAAVLENCRSIISVGMNYWTDVFADERPGNGRIARYAWGRDYHRVFGKKLRKLEQELKRLEPGCRTRRYVDTGPVMEKFWAQQAGLGWVGKHSNLVSPEFGSWLLLGEILTTAELEPDEPGADLCGTCTLCIQACPTGAIVEPYVVDARRCIAYLTIEYRGAQEDIPRELRDRMGNRIFGCDECLDACPYNNAAPATDETAFAPRHETQSPGLAELAQLSEEDFLHRFQGSPVRRAKVSGLRRNVAIAQANEKRRNGAGTL